MTYTLDVSALTEHISDLKDIRFAVRDLEQLCRENPDLRFEVDARGKLIVIFPTRSLTGQEKQVLNNPSFLSEEQLLPGLTVDLTDIF